MLAVLAVPGAVALPRAAVSLPSVVYGRRAMRSKCRAQAVAAARSGARSKANTPRMSVSWPDRRYQLAPVCVFVCARVCMRVCLCVCIVVCACAGGGGGGMNVQVVGRV